MKGGHAYPGGPTIAIMQPYLFPYVGYFQLAHSVDVFWLLDTVGFIRRGWMNRNNLMVNGTETMFSVPVTSGPQDQPILEKRFAPDAPHALQKLVGTLHNSYAKAPYLERALGLVTELRDTLAAEAQGADFTTATELTLRRTFETLGLDRPIRRVSALDLGGDVKGQARIIAACKAIGARRDVNMIGGRAMYDVEAFATAGVELNFLEPSLKPYDRHAGGAFVAGLSILDLVSWVSPDDLPAYLDGYALSHGD
jgi:phosphoglycolate phosphatase-like HAD superfamily hydrolase